MGQKISLVKRTFHKRCKRTYSKRMETQFFSTATSINCFKCYSSISMEDCIKFHKPTPCPKNTVHCRNMTVGVHVKLLNNEYVIGYERGCATQDQCLRKRCTGNFGEQLGVEKGKYELCEISCCKGNLCPEGNATASAQGPPVAGARSRSATVQWSSLVTLGILIIAVGTVFLLNHN